jgi:hypothetical protein
VTQVAFHPRALALTLPLLLLLWSAVDLRWCIALGTAVVVYDLLSFAGVYGTAVMSATDGR